MEDLITDKGVYCPLCKSRFEGSYYLRDTFPDDRRYWLAAMIMHYRHVHIVYYNRGVSHQSRKGQYGEYKRLVNERAKRQLLRKCEIFLKKWGFTVSDFEGLEGTERKTLKLAVKVLGGTIGVCTPRKKPLAQVEDPPQASIDRWFE